MKKRIIILGAGESGTGAALLAKAKGFDTFVSDMGAIGEDYRQVLKGNQIEFEEGGHSEEIILKADEVVKSPGIPERMSLVGKLKERDIPVISEIEFAARFTKAKFIAITGTNGKTTTALLTYHILKKAGINVGLAGNIGVSLAKQVIEDTFDYYVLEISSFQLDGMFDFKADIAILLNTTPDHLDSYNYQFDKYINSKFRIVQNMTMTDHFIYYKDSEILMQQVDKGKIEANKLQISLAGKVKQGAWLEEETLHFQVEAGEEPMHVKVADIIIKGRHNLINSMAAILTACLMKVKKETIVEGLADFKNAPHRLELIAEIDGVKFINDSKATNLDSVKYALESYKKGIIWIAGGIDKGNDYELVKDIVAKRVKALICLGKDNKKLIDFFSGIVPAIEETQDMNQAVRMAIDHAGQDDVVLLSPACASFDLFKNYEDRGDKFRTAVSGLKTANNI